MIKRGGGRGRSWAEEVPGDHLGRIAAADMSQLISPLARSEPWSIPGDLGGSTSLMHQRHDPTSIFHDLRRRHPPRMPTSSRTVEHLDD